MREPIYLEENPIAPVVITIAISACVGAAITLAIAFIGAMTAVTLSGPLGWLILGPTVIAGFTAALTWVLIGVPLWAMFGGWMFATHESGKFGIGMNNMGVTLFHEEHAIHKKVQELAWFLKLPPIQHVGWFKDDDINAFAMGVDRSNALVAFSQGAIDKLPKEEFDAVIAHELAHVANGDMRNMTFARGAQEALTFFLVFRKLKKFARWIFSPLAELNILHYSRQREFAADSIGAQLISPQAMIGALNAIESDTAAKPKPNDYDKLKFSSALSGGIWRTHPPIPKRIKTIENFAAKQVKHNTFPAKPKAAPPLETEVVTIEEKPLSEVIEIQTYKPWASSGLMSFGS